MLWVSWWPKVHALKKPFTQNFVRQNWQTAAELFALIICRKNRGVRACLLPVGLVFPPGNTGQVVNKRLKANFMFKTGCKEVILKLDVLCSTLACQCCPMGYLLLAGSGPRVLLSVALLAKEPLQGHIMLPLHLKVVSSHQMTRKEREEGMPCPASSAQAYVENCICSRVTKCLLKTCLYDANTLCSPWYLFHSEATPPPESCHC